MGALCSRDNAGVQLSHARTVVQTPAPRPLPHAEERELLGLSVWTITHTLAELCAECGCPVNEQRQYGTGQHSGMRRPTAHDIKRPVLLERTASFVCTRDGQEGAALVDVLEDRAGPGSVGRASLMLSYTWNYEIAQITTALEEYCKRTGRDPETTYVWICFACINQHRAQGSVPFEVFRAKFEKQVTKAGHILSLLAPWSAPANLKRAWCLLEIVTALALKAQGQCELEIIMPPAEEASFSEALLREFDTIIKSVCDIDMENARARPEDEENIKHLVRSGMGFAEVDKAVKGALREWLAETGKEKLAAIPEKERATSALINQLGRLLQAQGKVSEAEPLYREALEGRRATLGDTHPDTLGSINNLGLLLKAQGKVSKAEPLYREALEGRRATLGNTHPDTFTSINNLGVLLKAQGKVSEAEPLLREALEGSRATLGDTHPDTLGSINNLGLLLQAQGKLGEAEPLLREALEGSRATLGDTHPDTLISINNLGALLKAQGKVSKAEPLLREALEGRRATLGDTHPDTLISINNLGALLQAQGKVSEAEPLLREALEGFRATLGDTHPDTLISISNLGLLLEAQGKLGEAEPLYREALEGFRATLGNTHPSTLASSSNLGRLLKKQGELGEAEALL